ncbi:MAG TPA: AIR synthase-related protein [Blastocatellia bacterium]|nr:AIR synthase-related protein [Blastocatellia bacterium]
MTGGGLLENIPRILPEGTAAEIEGGSWPVLPVFNLLARLGKVGDSEMYRVFNMGLGMIIVASAGSTERIRQALQEKGQTSYRVGRIVAGSRTSVIIDKSGRRISL